MVQKKRGARGKFYITKASGDQQEFDFDKVRTSLKRAGADDALIEQVLVAVKKDFPFKTAREVYTCVYKVLKKLKANGIAGRYNLKNALYELGPSGYPFEKFVGEILRLEGYKVELNVVAQGFCVEHELDLVLAQGKQHIMVECKFHQRPGLKSDVKVSLYVKARFDDVEKKWRKDHKDESEFHEAWIVTNTRFTSQALIFGKCVGLKMMSWSGPEGTSLAHLIDKHGLHPITTLSTITREQKRHFMKKGVVLCRQVREKLQTLKSLGLSQAEIDAVVAESQAVCKVTV